MSRNMRCAHWHRTKTTDNLHVKMAAFKQHFPYLLTDELLTGPHPKGVKTI